MRRDVPRAAQRRGRASRWRRPGAGRCTAAAPAAGTRYSCRATGAFTFITSSAWAHTSVGQRVLDLGPRCGLYSSSVKPLAFAGALLLPARWCPACTSDSTPSAVSATRYSLVFEFLVGTPMMIMGLFSCDQTANLLMICSGRQNRTCVESPTFRRSEGSPQREASRPTSEPSSIDVLDPCDPSSMIASRTRAVACTTAPRPPP
jgi:hypothetical protein